MNVIMGVSIIMMVNDDLKMVCLFHGKSHLEMDDDWGYLPISGNRHIMKLCSYTMISCFFGLHCC